MKETAQTREIRSTRSAALCSAYAAMSCGEAIPRKFTRACASWAYICESCELGSLLSDVRSASNQHRPEDEGARGKLTGFQRVDLFGLTRNITHSSFEGRRTYPNTVHAQLLLPPHHPRQTANRIGRNDRRVRLRLARRIRPPLNRRALQLMERPVPALTALSPKSEIPISTVRRPTESNAKDPPHRSSTRPCTPCNGGVSPAAPRRSTSSSPRAWRRRVRRRAVSQQTARRLPLCAS